MTWQVPAELDGMRLDRVLAKLSKDVSRSQTRAAIEAGDVLVAGETVEDPRLPVSSGTQIALQKAFLLESGNVKPEKMPIDPIAESEDFVVIDKPPGLVVHPGGGRHRGTLANGLAARSASAALLPRAGIVHRLDKDTSGLLVAAKTQEARLNLIEQFRKRSAKRSYLAIVHGCPDPSGVVDRAIGRSSAERARMEVNASGRPALTRWRVLDKNDAYSLVSCELESGRTHQIRVHMEQIGHPVAGDQVYRRFARAEGDIFPRQMLHSTKLSFADPANGAMLGYDCPPPPDFCDALKETGLAYE